MLKAIKSNIPNAITCLNLLSGCMACIYSFRSGDSFGGLQAYQMVFVFICAAAVFDFCDGAAARLLRAYSEMGKELDSLSDLVSFGLAPALLMFNTVSADLPGLPWLAYGSLLIAVAAGLRLAKFNIDDRQTTSFIGLPVPANALFWVGYCALLHSTGIYNPWIIGVLIVAMSALMVSRLPIFSLKFKNFHLRENLPRYVIIAAAVLLVAIFGIPGIALTIALYVIMALIRLAFVK
ncbi:MAG: CDP-diacylglycerol--serine O-phosphatidyltransferase [Pseudoflavonifractor sp.]|nr:CDP-diacylglycerol--serine O-phosphatidyltransferase [Pseudoflavonifractor sp.]